MHHTGLQGREGLHSTSNHHNTAQIVIAGMLRNLPVKSRTPGEHETIPLATHAVMLKWSAGPGWMRGLEGMQLQAMEHQPLTDCAAAHQFN